MSGDQPFPDGLDPALRDLLVADPPARALRWVAEQLGAPVTGSAALTGGTSSAVHVLDAGGGRVVLRRHVRPDLADEASDSVRREAAALRAVAATAVPAPELLAADPDGEVAGVPSLLMSWRPGRVRWRPDDAGAWLGGMAALLPAVHAAPVDGVPEDFATYAQTSDEPPGWATDPEVWARAVAVFHGPVLDRDRTLVHRDLHPGNVLWTGDRVDGLVDWALARVGPPSIDVAHCRANLLRYRPDLADPFTAAAERATGRPFHPWADVASLVGMLDLLRAVPPPPACRAAIEHALARAVAACT